MRFLLVACAVLVFGPPLWAQEAFEIAVYPYATAHRGEWEFEGNVNYSRRGTTAFGGMVAPRQGQVRFAAELTRGISDNWEVAGYLLGAQGPDLGFEYAGWRLRSRCSAARAGRLPVNLGLSVEYETARPAFSESARTLEVTPILERRFGALQLLVNPTVERDFAFSESARTLEVTPILERRVGALQLLVNPTVERDFAGAERELEFEPRARTGLTLSRAVVLGIEYYGSLGESRQWHQVFPTADFALGDDLALHLGVGFGTAAAADRLVFKTAFELPLGGEAR